MNQTTTLIKTTSGGLAMELQIEFVENGLWCDIEGMPEAWYSLAHKVEAGHTSFEITPDEAKELEKALVNMIDIQYDHLDDAEGRGTLRAMEAMLKKARTAQ